ncbi:MAG TPA: carbamoyltransferase HypF [Sandaracinaceae bacterium LLY-WYZ-13_1]|nr:carbamoyltransferase HypF [Sandaracinaceae bacterium LLY-WYZ-13_1]
MASRRGMRIEVTGRVQGVGFRPFVAGCAERLGLAGTVRNRTGEVLIELEGAGEDLARFVRALEREAPPLARVEGVRTTEVSPRGRRGFAILPSEDAGRRPVFAPDAATCAACLAEMRDPADRRHGYPFSSCTDCGPRWTVVTGAPWDRERTTMAGFALCDVCRREYEDPRDRRYHAQPVACPACGPRLRGSLDDAIEALRAGAIVAIRGLGGFHLACDARRSESVRALRARKHRPDEPFALMVPSVEAARAWVAIDAAEAEALASPAAPIVLCRRSGNATEGPSPVDRHAPGTDGAFAPEVAPGLDRLGVMLPYTPLHHRLMEALRAPIVLTSANVHGAPMITDDDPAALIPLADAVLSHDRPIANRCDDSVVRVVDGEVEAVRVARGLAPLALPLPGPLRAPTLGLGGHLKASYALGDGDRAIVGPHVGDLDLLAAEEDYERGLARLSALHGFSAARLVRDLHPDYATRRIADRLGLPSLEVQHHHAHFAACLAEHGVDGEAIGVVFDGAGYGLDGAVWGGELFVGRIATAARVGHLRAVRLPGGERAILEPWRMALAHLVDARVDAAPRLDGRVDPARVRMVRSILGRAPRTTSVGRLFDAVAWLVGLVDAPSHEAQGPMRLEAAARAAGGGSRAGSTAYRFALDGELVIDPRPIWRPLLGDLDAGVPVPLVARRFHDGLVDVTARTVRALAERHGLSRVALSGGAMLNLELSGGLAARLRDAGLTVYRPRRLPANDGGLCYGQLAIVAARDAEEGRP